MKSFSSGHFTIKILMNFFTSWSVYYAHSRKEKCHEVVIRRPPPIIATPLPPPSLLPPLSLPHCSPLPNLACHHCPSLLSSVAIVIRCCHHCHSPTFCRLLPLSLVATSSLRQPFLQILISHCRRCCNFFSAILPPLVHHRPTSCDCRCCLSVAEPCRRLRCLLSTNAADSCLHAALIISFPNHPLLVAVDLRSSSLLPQDVDCCIHGQWRSRGDPSAVLRCHPGKFYSSYILCRKASQTDHSQ
jgi:hypothetical protein